MTPDGEANERRGHDSERAHRSMGAGALAGTLGSAAFAIFELLLVVIVTQGLGAAGAGVFFAVMALFMLALGVLMIGPTQGLIRAIARALAQGRRERLRPLVRIALLPALAIATLVAAAAFLAAPAISALLVGGDAAIPYLRTMAPLLPCAVVMHLLLGATRGLPAMRPTVLVDRIGVGGGRPLLILAVLIAGGGAVAVGLAWGLPYLLAAIAAWVWTERLLTARAGEGGERRPDRDELRGMAGSLWSFAGVRGAASAVELTTRWIDIPLVAALASPEAAGIYATVSRLAAASEVASRGVMLSFTPWISALIARGDSSGARRSYQLATAWTMAASLPILFLLLGYPALLLGGLFGSTFEAGATALAIIVAAKLLAAAVGPITVVLLMEGRSWLNAANATAGMAINAGLNVWLIPVLGVEGAAIAWAASLLFLNAAPLWQLYRSDGFQPVHRGWAILAGTSILAFGIVGIGLPELAGLGEAAGAATLALGGGAIYAVVLYRRRAAIGLDLLLSWPRRRAPAGSPVAAGTQPEAQRALDASSARASASASSGEPASGPKTPGQLSR